MNLERMLEMQKALDERIIKEKGLEGKDLYPNTIFALQIEFAEFANEGRWFKHWSENRGPRINVKCRSCKGKGFNDYVSFGEHSTEDCRTCETTGLIKDRNPLLEEYVDCLHFFLSVALQKGWESALFLYEEQLKTDGEFDGGLTGVSLEMLYFLNKSNFEHPKKEVDEKFKNSVGFPQKQYFFRIAWNLFLDIGTHGFGFTLEQIEEAYYAKNEINHARQQEGY